MSKAVTGEILRQALLLPVMIYAAMGLVISMLAHLMALDGLRLGADPLFKGVMFGGVPLMIVVGFLMVPRVGWTAEGLDVSVAVAGCPAWLRWVTNALFAYAFLNFMLAMAVGPHSPPGTPAPSVETWRVFSGGFIAFYATALAALTSVYRHGVVPDKCPSGHVLGYNDELCLVCGVKISPT